MLLLHMILKTASPSMYNVEECSFRQMQEMQRVIQMTVVPALPRNQIHENSHIHITPRLPPPAAKQPLNYSISALVVGPPGHLATILSVSSLTDEWPYCRHRGAVFRKTVLSQQEHVSRSCVSTHTHTAVYLHICAPQRKLSTCPHLVKTQGRLREDIHCPTCCSTVVHLAYPTASNLGMASLHCTRGRSSSPSKLYAS